MCIKRILYAPNVHQGGGKTLLVPLIKALSCDKDVLFILDERLALPIELLSEHVIWVKPTLSSRLWCELKLNLLITHDTAVLCMGNLPPLFVKRGVQNVFVQNRYLVETTSLTAFPALVRVRIMIERWWLRACSMRVNSFIVQTVTMQNLMLNTFGVKAEIRPFLPMEMRCEPLLDLECGEKLYDFVYIASGEPHKNHKALIYAWIELAKESTFPSLCLLIDEKKFPDLCDWILSEVASNALNIFLVGECSHDDIHKIYQQSAALIYPSLFESFGLPLIEAAILGMPVLASNKPYVTDVIIPSAVFEPDSFQNIALAIKTFKFVPASLNVNLLDERKFLENSFKK